jgi:hypothetical protein
VIGSPPVRNVFAGYAHLATSNAVNTLTVSHWSATASYSAASSLRMRRQSSVVIKAEVVRNSSARSRQRFASLADIWGNPKSARRPLKLFYVCLSLALTRRRRRPGVRRHSRR